MDVTSKAQPPVMNEEILVKIYKYCAYQDRCKSEILQKLEEIGVEEPAWADEIMEHLRRERFWDEERYARSFARGKFRIKSWGRIKIRQELRQKGIPASMIDLALKEEIDEEDYLSTLQRLVQKKKKERKDDNSWETRAKIYRFLSQKGYESDLINEEMQELPDE